MCVSECERETETERERERARARGVVDRNVSRVFRLLLLGTQMQESLGYLFF